jgi:biopolymer transport protein ExbB/TolQ
MMFGVQRAAIASGIVALIGSHISVGDFAFVLIAAAYILSIIRDWRPARTLRDENREVRAEREKLQHQYDELLKKYNEIEARCAQLEKSRDFHEAFQESLRAIDQARADASHEHERILNAIEAKQEAEKKAWEQLTQTLAAVSTGVTALAAGINAGAIPVESPTEGDKK